MPFRRFVPALSVAGPVALSLALVSAVVPAARAGDEAVPSEGPPSVVNCGGTLNQPIITGEVGPEDARTYRVFPVTVPEGTERIELAYSWADNQPAAPGNPITQTVFDLGLWDADGPASPKGFRGWSGSRGGRLHESDPPVFVEAGVASRGYLPGPIEAGTWWPEVGIAAVGPGGATFAVHMACLPGGGSDPFVADHVDPAFVVQGSRPGWYHGDFHMHGYHSNPAAPHWTNGQAEDPDSFVEFARAAGLDFTPVTDYVTTQHWRELGPVQETNPDLLIWPAREVITYFGHATIFGETPSVVDYRHGFTPPGPTEGPISLGDIQRDAADAGALFGIAHPTIFPGPLFANFCRGCEFTLDDEIDFSLVDTIEVLTGPVLVDQSDIGAPGPTPLQIQNPFVESAIDYWEDKLLAGHRITAVSGSDDKLGPGLGSSATAVHATELSQTALIEGIRSGRAYVRTRGVHHSPTVEITATDPACGDGDGDEFTIGDSIPADAVLAEAHVTGAAGQLLRISADGTVVAHVPILSDNATIPFAATALATSGPLGTFWRVDTLDAQSLTTIGNPFFLTGELGCR